MGDSVAAGHDPAAADGLADYLVSEVLGAAAALGVRRLSLGLTPFRSVFELGGRIGAGPFLRAQHRLLARRPRLAARYQAAARYGPAWSPRFLCLASARDLGPVLIAAVQVGRGVFGVEGGAQLEAAIGGWGGGELAAE